eukprot:COSAG05_NODE_2584_length_2873_cov_6.100216_3_plen_66_part_00
MGKNVPVPEGDGGDGNLQHLTHRRDDGARERSEIRDGVKDTHLPNSPTNYAQINDPLHAMRAFVV